MGPKTPKTPRAAGLAWVCTAALVMAACGADSSGGGADTTRPADTAPGWDTTPPADTWRPLDVTPSDTAAGEDTADTAAEDADGVSPTDTTGGDTTGGDTAGADSAGPTDTATPGDTTAAADVDADAADATGPGCLTGTVTGQLHRSDDGAAAYYVFGDFGLGDPDVGDVLSIEFYQDTPSTGAFALGVSPNDNYKTCSECVVVYADYDEATDTTGAYFFQTGGALVVDPTTPPGGPTLTVELTALSVTEVTFNPVTAVSTPVPGGRCYDLAVPSPLTTTPGPVTCGALTLDATLTQDATHDTVYTALGDFGLGAPGVADLVSLEFYSSATGLVDLASAANANYQSCEQCVLALADYDPGSGAYAGVYFQTGGTLAVHTGTPPGSATFRATLTNLSLAEVTIDTTSYLSTPVPGGGCYDLSGTATVAATPATCTPFCGDHVCGPDGCGGVCGGGCGGGACTLHGTCAATPSCAQLTLGGAVLDAQGFSMFAADLTGQQLGAAVGFDELELFFFDDAASGVIDLGSPFNSNWATCTECVLIELDWDGPAPRHFFQTSGTMTIAPASNLEDGPFTVGIDGLNLVEVSYDPNDGHTTPVPGGACIDVTVSPDLTFVP